MLRKMHIVLYLVPKKRSRRLWPRSTMIKSRSCHPLSTSTSTSFCFALYFNMLIRKKEVADNATAALWGLRGTDWGQYGEVAFFLQGAFRTKENVVKTFQYVIHALLAKARAYRVMCSLSVGIPSEGGCSFQQDLDWTEHRRLFKKWASEMIPSTCTTTSPFKIKYYN